MDHVLTVLQSRWPIETQPRSSTRARSGGERRYQNNCELQGRSKSAIQKATRQQSCQGANGEREGSEREQSGRARVEACAYPCSGLNESQRTWMSSRMDVAISVDLPWSFKMLYFY